MADAVARLLKVGDEQTTLKRGVGNRELANWAPLPQQQTGLAATSMVKYATLPSPSLVLWPAFLAVFECVPIPGIIHVGYMKVYFAQSITTIWFEQNCKKPKKK